MFLLGFALNALGRAAGLRRTGEGTKLLSPKSFIQSKSILFYQGFLIYYKYNGLLYFMNLLHYK